MGRYVEDAAINQPLDVVSMTMEDFIYHNRFSRTDWNGEPVYMSLDAEGKERYIVWSYASGILHIEAWMKGAFGDETDLNGMGKGKKEYKELIEKVLQKLHTHSGESVQSGYIGHDPIYHNDSTQGTTMQNAAATWNTAGVQNAAQQTYTQSWMNSNTGSNTNFNGNPNTASGTLGGNPNIASGTLGGNPNTTPGTLGGNPNVATGSNIRTLGLIALFSSFIFPIVGLIVAIIALSKANNMEMNDGEEQQVKTGKTLSKIAIVITICYMGISFLLPVIIRIAYFL